MDDRLFGIIFLKKYSSTFLNDVREIKMWLQRMLMMQVNNFFQIFHYPNKCFSLINNPMLNWQTEWLTLDLAQWQIPHRSTIGSDMPSHMWRLEIGQKCATNIITINFIPLFNFPSPGSNVIYYVPSSSHQAKNYNS